MLRIATRKSFGLFSGLREVVKTPLKYINKLAETGKGDHSPLGNITEKFEDEASEWKSYIVENAYELNTFQNPEQIIQGNFGTVDNPHLIFTSDLPYRMVGCTGAPGEDDYEGHEIMYFMLREGPLQRCGSCGQVFKLIRLRDEPSAENEYYKRDFVPTSIDEFGEADHWIQLNAIRFMMLHSYEHTHFEVASDPVVSLKNNDDHDRLLVDPAYRLEQLKIAQHKATVALETERKLARTMHSQYERFPLDFTKDNYENLVNAEIAIAHLNRHFKAVQRFNMRKFLDPANHERREKRMLERAHERINVSETFYADGHSETELQFRDYYESDAEALGMLTTNVQAEKERILSNMHYDMKNFKFMEQYAQTDEQDGSSFISKKVFRFNYRQAFYPHADHVRKETRMRAKFEASGFADKVALARDKNAKALLKDGAKGNPLEFYELVVAQALENYKAYFESDLEEDFGYVQALPLSEKKEFVGTLDDNGLLKQPEEELVAVQVQRFRDMPNGAVQTAFDFLEHMQKEVGAELNNLTGMNLNEKVLQEAAERKAKKEEQAKKIKE